MSSIDISHKHISLESRLVKEKALIIKKQPQNNCGNCTEYCRMLKSYKYGT